MPGQCRNCMLRRDTFSCSRKNGGNYRRPPQWRSSSICADCAISQLAHHTPDQPGEWSTSTLRGIVASIDTDEAREAVAGWDAKVEEKRLASEAHEERARPYWGRVHERREVIEWIRAQGEADGMDLRTCNVLAGAIKSGDAGHESTGITYAPDGSTTWERTMREQILDYLPIAERYGIDETTRAALIDGIRAGAHRPDSKDQA